MIAGFEIRKATYHFAGDRVCRDHDVVECNDAVCIENVLKLRERLEQVALSESDDTQTPQVDVELRRCYSLISLYADWTVRRRESVSGGPEADFSFRTPPESRPVI